VLSAWDALRRFLRALPRHRHLPLILLGVVAALSIGARVFHLDIPSEDRPGQGFVFDEKYYVNAARVIAGAPMNTTDTYAQASPAGTDPNAEHPQLGKVLIAASIKVLGDNPVGWRITAVIFGTAALLLLYWAVRCLGGSRWLALGATAIAAADNLWLVHGRIAVLDIYCVPFMLAGLGFYLRRRPVVAGALIGVGTCVKEFALYAVFAILLLEALRGVRWLLQRGGENHTLDWKRLLRPAAMTATTVVTFVALLAVLDAAVPPYHDGHPVTANQSALCDRIPVVGNACNHIAFMNSYAANLRSPKGPVGIASYPWQFWGNVEPIDYYTVRSTVTVGKTVTAVNTVLAFRGEIQPVVLVTAWFGILLALWRAGRRRDDLDLFVVAWIVATWLPAELASLFGQRTTYIYYMVVTTPALYVACARLLSSRRIPRWLLGVWVGVLLAGFAIVYPFRTLTGT
jgi:predicted membrane-bound dolichyl-phosphate-mannose-protein mannosyltransferase